MLEYVFFDERPYLGFLQFLRSRGIEPETSTGEDGFDLDTFEVRLPEELDDALAAEIEACYDRMMDLNQELFDQAAAGGLDNQHAAGVVVNLSDGRAAYARVDPKLLNKVLQVLTPPEFGQIVDAIASAVEDPDSHSLCQKPEP
jgi:hypothetical protein